MATRFFLPKNNVALNSVDELVEHYIARMRYDDMESLYYSLAVDLSGPLFGALKSETNKPSKHDLFIINYILKYLDLDRDFSYHAQILEIYKNRKES